MNYTYAKKPHIIFNNMWLFVLVFLLFYKSIKLNSDKRVIRFDSTFVLM